MRVYLKITPSNRIVPFDHQPLLVGSIHKWLGQNEEHGNISLYSFSRLEEATLRKDGLLFENRCGFFFSSYYPELIKQLISGIQKDPSMFSGLSVKEVILIEDPDLSDRKLFYPASPIFIKRRINDKIEQVLYDNPDASQYLKETLQTKLEKAGIPDDSFNIHFDLSYSKAGTKLVTYKGIKNKTSWCPVIIEGKPETKLFVWNVGLGN